MQADGRDDKAHILGVLPAENDDAADELAAPVLVHQRNKAVSKLHFDGLHRQEGIHIVDVLVVVALPRRGLLGRLLLLRHGGRRSLAFHAALNKIAAADEHAAAHKERKMRRVGDQREENEDDAGGQDRSRLGLELGHHILIEAPLRNGAGDDHARSGGDHQRGEL